MPPKLLSVMRKIEWSNYITQSLICAGLLTIGISTLSVFQNHSSTDELEVMKLESIEQLVGRSIEPITV